jgi:hypothetical protein
MAGLVPATHTLRFSWVFMGRRDKPGDDGFILRENAESNWVVRFCGP